MKLQLKRSNVLENLSAKEPTAAQMAFGELAVNYNNNDPCIFLKDSDQNIIRIAGANSISSGKTPNGSSPPSSGNTPGDVFFNTTDNLFYYWDGSNWIAVKGDNAYVNISGDNMVGNLSLGTNKIVLNASTGSAQFSSKVSSASTVLGDPANTLVTKDYVDNGRTVSGDGALTIKTNGNNASASGTFTANQSGPSTLTLPAIRFQDLANAPTIPAEAQSGTLNIKDATGSSLGTFNANATTGTETVITLPSSSVPVIGNGLITITQPGETDQTFQVNQSSNTTISLKNDNTLPNSGSLQIKNYNDSAFATGSFNADNSGTGTLTLRQIKYDDISGTPIIPGSPGNGTITITQPGVVNQSFQVNQSGNTTINLKNDNTQITPGSGTLNIKDSNGSSLGSFSADATTGTETVIRLPASVAPTPPGNGTITIVQPGTSNQSFQVNQSGNTTINLKNDNTQSTPGSGSLTIKNYNDSSTASGSFNANQSSGSTITLKQIKYADLSGVPAIPPAAGNGTITIKQGSSTKGSFTVNQAGNSTVTLDAIPAVPATNLGNTTTSSTVQVTSSTGSNTTIAAASGSQAGVMTTSQVSDLNTAKSNASTALTNAASAQSTADTALEQSIKEYCTTRADGSEIRTYGLSVSLNRAGVYDYTFDDSKSNNEYTVTATIQEAGDTGSLAYYCSVQNKTTSGFQVKTWFRQDTPGGGPVNSQFSNQGHGVMVIN